MIPLYITHDGQAFTAKISRKKGIYGEREYHYNSLSESLRTYSQNITASIYTSLSLAEDKSSFIFDEELASWCSESLGAGFSSMVSDFEAVYSVVKNSIETPEQYQIIYLLEGRVKILLVENDSVISVIHMAQEELETVGIDKLIDRSRSWYKRCDIAFDVETVYIAGEFPHSSTRVTHLFEKAGIYSVVAAGIPLIGRPQILYNAPAVHKILRYSRTVLIFTSLLFLILTGLFFLRDKMTLQVVQESIQSSPYQIELSDEQIRNRDSLSQLSVDHITTYRHLSGQRRWSDILERFSEVPHEGLTLSRFGSRESNGVLNLAFDGEGKSEKAVTGYVQKLKESSSFSGVQLMQIDRKSNGKFRFRIQCNVQ